MNPANFGGTRFFGRGSFALTADMAVFFAMATAKAMAAATVAMVATVATVTTTPTPATAAMETRATTAAIASTASEPSHNIGDYDVFAQTSLVWGGAASMPEAVRMGTGDGVLAITSDTDLSDEDSLLAAGSVTIDGASVVAQVFADVLSVGEEATLLTEPQPLGGVLLAADAAPEMPAVACGTNDLTVDADNSPFTLKGGTWGHVLVTSGAELRLEPGARYVLCSLKLRADTTLRVHGDNLVLVADHVATANRVTFAGDDACAARWLVAGREPSPAPYRAALDFGSGSASNRSRIAGQFFTPGVIHMAQHNDYVGRFWGGSVEADAASPVTRTLARCSIATCGDGRVDATEDCDDGGNDDGDCCSALCLAREPGQRCNDGLFCTTDDYCSADGVCEGSGDPCIGADGDDDCRESCDEAADTCRGADPDGSFCDDEDACVLPGQCQAGVCVGMEPVVCDDGDLCTADLCDPVLGICSNPPEPQPDCNELGSASLDIELGLAPSGRKRRDALAFRWRGDRHGLPTDPSQFGAPEAGDAHALCVYDIDETGVPELSYRLDLDADHLGTDSVWTRKQTPNTLVYKLRARSGTDDGVSQAKLVLDKHRRATLRLRAGTDPGCGVECRDKFIPPAAVAADRLFAAEPGVVVQWRSEAGGCWGGMLERVKTNDVQGFEGRSLR
jgi:cysteine-rich repeat protein